jgi:HD-like signal output (HDOD) protein
LVLITPSGSPLSLRGGAMENESILQQVFSNIEHIGTPRGVSLKLLEKADSSDFDVDEMASMVSRDATIAALILKTANSVHFSRGNRISTIKHAIVHLGAYNVKRLLFAVEMMGIFHGCGSTKDFPEMQFWSHTLAGAHLASKYAALKKSCDPAIAYVAGLLRNIGVLAIRQYAPREFERMVLLQAVEKTSFEQLSEFVLGISHRELGYMIGLRWNLPGTIVDAIRNSVDVSTMTSEVDAVREAIFFADELLHVANFCLWDLYYMPGNFDFHAIPAESMLNETKDLVETIMGEFWA